MRWLVLLAIVALASCQSSPSLTTLDDVNNYVNSFPYVADGKDDWKEPYRFYRDGGDCEDFAIAKAHLLHKHGLAKPEDMLLLIVRDPKQTQAHAVLYVKGVVLDNQVKEITSWQTANRRYRLLQALSFRSLRPGIRLK